MAAEAADAAKDEMAAEVVEDEVAAEATDAAEGG